MKWMSKVGLIVPCICGKLIWTQHSYKVASYQYVPDAVSSSWRLVPSVGTLALLY